MDPSPPHPGNIPGRGELAPLPQRPPVIAARRSAPRSEVGGEKPVAGRYGPPGQCIHPLRLAVFPGRRYGILQPPGNLCGRRPRDYAPAVHRSATVGRPTLKPGGTITHVRYTGFLRQRHAQPQPNRRACPETPAYRFGPPLPYWPDQPFLHHHYTPREHTARDYGG